MKYWFGLFILMLLFLTGCNEHIRSEHYKIDRNKSTTSELSEEQKIQKKYSMKCVDLSPAYRFWLFRCENVEMICYTGGTEGGLDCKFKTEQGGDCEAGYCRLPKSGDR